MSEFRLNYESKNGYNRSIVLSINLEDNQQMLDVTDTLSDLASTYVEVHRAEIEIVE